MAKVTDIMSIEEKPVEKPVLCSEWSDVIIVGKCSVCGKRLIVVHKLEDGTLLSQVVHYEPEMAGELESFSPACPGAKIVPVE